MKKNFKYFKYITFGLLVFILTTCKEEFLEIKPIAAENSGSFYLNMEQGEQAVTAIYSTFHRVTAWDLDLLMDMGDIASDDSEAGGEYVNEVPVVENINRLTPLTNYGQFSNVYTSLFRAIYFANIALEKLPQIKETDPEANPELIDIRIGEAKFLRALNYSYLTKVFGGVPLVDRVLGAEEYKMGRAELKALYSFIEQDLKEAIELLPEKNALTDIGHASKGAAKALLARILLFESSYAKNYAGDERFSGMTERWQESLEYSEQVINSGLYKLIGSNGERFKTWRGPDCDGYRYVFTSNGDNSDEAIFEIQDIADGLGYGEARGQAFSHWTSARRYIDAKGKPQNTSYWGLDIPNQNLVDAFEKGDPRYETTIADQGDSIEISGGKRFLISFDKCVTGYYSRKYEASSSEYIDLGGPWHSAPMNIRLFRYAEVILNAAEAAYMLGNNAKALQYINMIRSRARNCGNTGVPADLSSVSFEQIVNERRVELAMEGHRYFDLIRWNLGTKYLNHLTTDGYQVIFESPKHDFFPLPSREVSVSGGKLQQYPGW